MEKLTTRTDNGRIHVHREGVVRTPADLDELIHVAITEFVEQLVTQHEARPATDSTERPA